MALIANQACGGARFAALLKVSSVRANAALLIFIMKANLTDVYVGQKAKMIESSGIQRTK
jgi:hypothetical protein